MRVHSSCSHVLFDREYTSSLQKKIMTLTPNQFPQSVLFETEVRDNRMPILVK